MVAKILFSIIIFMGILALLASSLVSIGGSGAGFTNQTNQNLTVIGGGQLIPPQCDYSSNIPIFGGLIWGADCIAQYIGFMFGLSTTSSGVAWLGIIFGACSAILILIGIMLLRGLLPL